MFPRFPQTKTKKVNDPIVVMLTGDFYFNREKEAKRSATESAVLLGSNVLLAVAVIFSNKIVFTKLDFKFPIFLTLIHYVTIFIGIEACRRLGVYRQTPWKQLPLNQDMVLMVLLVAVGVALNNASLRANAVGTYQLLKLLVTPGICICDYLLMGKTISRKRAYILLIVCFGVAVATVSDVELRAFGASRLQKSPSAVPARVAPRPHLGPKQTCSNDAVRGWDLAVV